MLRINEFQPDLIHPSTDKEKLCYLQFESDEERDDWAEAMKATIKTLRAARPRVISNPIELTEQLMNQIPKNSTFIATITRIFPQC